MTTYFAHHFATRSCTRYLSERHLRRLSSSSPQMIFLLLLFLLPVCHFLVFSAETSIIKCNTKKNARWVFFRKLLHRVLLSSGYRASGMMCRLDIYTMWSMWVCSLCLAGGWCSGSVSSLILGRFCTSLIRVIKRPQVKSSARASRKEASHPSFLFPL